MMTVAFGIGKRGVTPFVRQIHPWNGKSIMTMVSCLSPRLANGVGASAFAQKSDTYRRPLGSTSHQGIGNKVSRLTEAKTQLLDDVDMFIFDCDGVIWKGNSLIDGIPETLRNLRKIGKQTVFVTNNSTKSRSGYKAKFDMLGLDMIPATEIFSSSFAAAAYLEKTNFKASGKKVYVIGEAGICEELDLAGIPYLGGPDDNDKIADTGPGGRVDIDKDVGAVVVGLDRMINYYKIQYAQLCINTLNAQFIATNLDAVGHFTEQQEWAGNGSMVGAIRGCTGRHPHVVGKPSPLLVEYLESEYGVKRDRICMVGDRLDTDILFGTENGLKSLLVLSGVTTKEKLMDSKNTIVPDFYADDINALLEK